MLKNVLNYTNNFGVIETQRESNSNSNQTSQRSEEWRIELEQFQSKVGKLQK